MKKQLWILLIAGIWVYQHKVLAQDRILDQFKNYAANTTRERVYLHLSQHYVQPGDRVWFSAYIFDDGAQLLSVASKVLYVNVVNDAGEVVLDEKVPLEEGRGEGYLDIPDDFPKGAYIVRAYTGWMRNFEAEHFFRDWLWVNLRPQELSLSASSADDESEIDVQVVAEGNLSPVSGLTTRYAVRVRSKSGVGRQVSGEVIDKGGTHVATFSTNKYGYGAFILQVKENETYQLRIKTASGPPEYTNLPDVQPEGLAMLATATPSVIRVSLQAKWESGGDHQYRVVLQSKGTMYLDQLLDFDRQKMQVLNIPADKLKAGVYQLVLLDKEAHPVAERLFQIYPQAHSQQIQLSSEQAGRRNRVSVDLNASAAVAYSVSISDKGLEGNYQPPAPPEWFFMGDGLELDPSECLGFFDPGFRAPANWDLLLLTRRHPAYDWLQVMSYKFSYPRWPYEKFISAYGQIRNSDSLLLGQSLFTFYSFAHAEVIPARTDYNGWFLLPLFDYYGTTNIIGLADNKEVTFSGMQIDIESGLPSTELEKGMFRLLQLSGPRFSDQLRDKLVFKSSLKRHVPGLYPERQVLDAPSDFNPITRNPDDYILDLREYLSFSSLREVIMEIGRGIFTRERNGKRVILLYDPVNGQAFPEPALIFINGIPTIDYDLVLTLDPDIIETIRLYRSATAQERFGAMGRNGILSINTKDRALEIPRQENITFAFEGFQPKAEPANGPLTGAGTSLPDFRHQLYWQSGADIPQRLEFTTSDILSEFEVQLIAVDATGNWRIGKKTVSTLPQGAE